MDRLDRVLTRVALCASAAMFAWMLRPVLTGRIPFTGDMLHFHYPVRDFYARALAAGWSFEWMPSLYTGFDLVGEGQLGAYHPFHWLLYRFLPLDTAFGIEAVAAYPFLFAGTWLFLRRVCGDGAAAFGALLFTFCGFTISHGVHVNIVSIAAHVPWLLWAIRRTYMSSTWRDRARWAAIVALLTGSQCLLGHPQTVWFSSLIEVSYLVSLAASSRFGAWLRSAEVVAGAKLLGLAIGAAQIVATMHAVRQSTRTSVDASSYALPVQHLLQLVDPYLLWGRVHRWSEITRGADEFAAYGGAVTLSLAMWWLASTGFVGAAFRQPESSPAQTTGAGHSSDSLALWGIAIAVLGAWLALGAVGGLYLLQTRLPVISMFRAPARYIVFTHLGTAVAAAIAMARLTSDADRPRSGVWAPWVLAALSTIAALWWIARDGAPLAGTSAVAAALGPVLFTLAAGLITLAVRGVRWAPVALVLVAAGDLALYGFGGVVAWQDYATRQDVINISRDDTKGRVPIGPSRIARGGPSPNVMLVGGYRALEGYLGWEPVRLLDYRTAKALRVACVEYVHADLQRLAQLPDAERVSNTWFRIAPPLDRVRLITDVRISQNPAVDLNAIAVERTALSPRDIALDLGPPGTLTVVHDLPGDIRVRTTTPSRQLLVVSEGYDDGWTAAVDGASVRLERINGDSIGCLVPAGTHDVSLRFAPASRRIGQRVSVLGLVAAGALLLASSVTRDHGRRRRSTGPRRG